MIDALIISDTETMMNMFDAGQLDMMPNITKEYIEKYGGTGEAIQLDGATIWYCAVNTISDRGAASTLLKNNAFRKALMYVIPRDQLVAAARGDGSFGYTRICPENMSTSYNNKSVGEMFPYTPYPVAGDVDKAKEMFAQALKETGLSANNLPTLTLLTFDDAGAKTCAEVIQNLLKSNFGMEVEIDTQTYSARQEKEHSLSNPRNVESLGNKVLLEKRINIRASDYRFSDKVKYYTGFENNRKQKKEGTKIKELTDLAANATDFTESDIVERNAKIILNFITFMHNNDLLCED